MCPRVDYIFGLWERNEYETLFILWSIKCLLFLSFQLNTVTYIFWKYLFLFNSWNEFIVLFLYKIIDLSLIYYLAWLKFDIVFFKIPQGLDGMKITSRNSKLISNYNEMYIYFKNIIINCHHPLGDDINY